MTTAIKLGFSLAATLTFAAPVLAQDAAARFEFTPGFEACAGDTSLSDAQANGITLGISPSPPYTSLDPATGKASGIDVEIVEAALGWLGIDKITYEVAPFPSLTPSLISERIDMVAANIHVTPDRLKVISFTGPGWWYGPAITVGKGNPKAIHSFEDLKNHSVGAIAGSAADEYLRSLGVEVVPFQTDADQFISLSQGRVDVILEDDIKVATYIAENKDESIEMVAGVEIPDELIFQYGYGYARYGIRMEDCMLRSAMSMALAEVRGNGQVSGVLRNYGLTDRNLFYFPVSN